MNKVFLEQGIMEKYPITFQIQKHILSLRSLKPFSKNIFCTSFPSSKCSPHTPNRT